MSKSKIFDEILKTRGLRDKQVREAFLNPDYTKLHDPFLLPDMAQAVKRLEKALKNQERITIYGDYDIDGLTATTVLIDGLNSFGFKNVQAYIPNRFVEGYGLTVEAVEKIAPNTDLMITVDCGSLSHKEIQRANDLGMDIIVTDHHNVAPEQPPAIAVINPKRLLQDHPESYEKYILQTDEKLYPFLDLAGVGVAFKLIQALLTKLKGLENGQEKWLLDLVALGTVCDSVSLLDENRTIVHYGLKVMSKTKRPGLKALMAVAGVKPEALSARSLGFGLGPRLNAAGRLETAQYALDLLTTNDSNAALEKASLLDEMNRARRTEQDRIFAEAIEQAEKFAGDAVLVVSNQNWNHGIIGIVAAKLLEKYQKPTFVLEEMGEESKGSARSYGDFSAADAVRFADDIITKGGGHRLAAGVTLPTKNIGAFRKRVNEFYSQNLKVEEQIKLLLPSGDIVGHLGELTETLIEEIKNLEPFGQANPEPIIATKVVKVIAQRSMGDKNQHLRLVVEDENSHRLEAVCFNAPSEFFVAPGAWVKLYLTIEINEWNGQRRVQGMIKHLEQLEI